MAAHLKGTERLFQLEGKIIFVIQKPFLLDEIITNI
jgi:hypothetical protein